MPDQPSLSTSITQALKAQAHLFKPKDTVRIGDLEFDYEAEAGP